MSDAAGAALEWRNGVCKNASKKGDRGVAAVGHHGDQIYWVSTVKWPEHLIVGQKSSSGAYFGSKSTTLETVGLLLPFFGLPRELAGRHVLLRVDNMAVVYAWQKKYCCDDPETSLLIRCLHVLEPLLQCKIYVQHLRRVSNKVAEVADSLTRTSTTSQSVLAELKNAQWFTAEGPLIEWLENPVVDWTLPTKIIDWLKERMDVL